jgi:hypothetical protein
MQQAPKNSNKLIIILLVLAVFGGFAMIALVGLGGALFVVTKTPAPPAVKASPSVKMKSGAKPLKLDGSMLGGAATMGKKYKPTSSYMEPGADSDVTELSFDKGSGGGAFLAADPVELRIAQRDEELVPVRRIQGGDLFERNQRAIQEGVGLPVGGVHGKGGHMALRVLGEIEGGKRGDIARAENDKVAHVS